MTGNDGKARVNVDLNDFQYKPMPSRKRDGHRADTDGLDDRIEALQAELARIGNCAMMATASNGPFVSAIFRKRFA